MHAFRALRIRPFALIWVGQTLSRIGDFVYEVVIAWWVLQETGSAVVMGSVLIVTFLPIAVFTLFGGAVVDRVARVPVLLASDLVRCGAVLAVAALAAGDRLELWMVFALSLFFGVADAFFQPAYFALVPELVPQEDLPSANALSSMSFQLGRVVGPTLGGIIVAAGGVVMGFAINGVSFLIAGLLLLPLLAGSKVPERAEGEAGQSAAARMLADTREGVATVRGDSVLWIGVVAGAIIGAFLVGPFLVSMPFMVEARFGDDPRYLGFILAMFPLGFILGSLWGGRRSELRHRGILAYGGMAAAGLMLAIFGLPLVPETLGAVAAGFGLPLAPEVAGTVAVLAVLAVAAIVNGFGLELAGLVWIHVLQTRVPDEQLGRVASLDQLLSWIRTPIAFAVAGVATEAYGPNIAFLAGGCGAAAVALLALAHPAIRGLD
jgi:MFS family permease